MSKARGQSKSRATRKGSLNKISSTKLTKSGRNLSATTRTKKYSHNLTK